MARRVKYSDTRFISLGCRLSHSLHTNEISRVPILLAFGLSTEVESRFVARYVRCTLQDYPTAQVLYELGNTDYHSLSNTRQIFQPACRNKFSGDRVTKPNIVLRTDYG